MNALAGRQRVTGRLVCGLTALLTLGGCAKEPERCEPQMPKQAQVALSCEACTPTNGLCAGEPVLLATAYRAGGIVATGGDFGFAAAWHAMPNAQTPPAVDLALLGGNGAALAPVTQLSTGRGEQYPHLALDDSRLGVTWSDSDASGAELPLVAEIDLPADGVRGGLRLALPMTGGGELAWTGSDFGIGWVGGVSSTGSLRGSSVLLSRAGVDGARTAEDRTVYERPATRLGLVWTGTHFTVALGDSASDPDAADAADSVYLLELGEDDSVPAEPLTLRGGVERPGADAIEVQALRWTGSDYALLWSETNDLYPHALYLARVTPGIGKITSMALVSSEDGASFSPSLVQLGSGFAVVWQEPKGDQYTTVFATYSDDLTLASGPLVLSSPSVQAGSRGSSGSAVAVSGAHVGVFWTSTNETGLGCTESPQVVMYREVLACD